MAVEERITTVGKVLAVVTDDFDGNIPKQLAWLDSMDVFSLQTSE